ncbi:MAG TPA: hypothetical protein VFZ24_06190 [Longimicrobiales bacterium]
MTRVVRRRVMPLLALLALTACADEITNPVDEVSSVSFAKGSPGKPGGESAGNNLSYPVIWAEGVTKALRGSAGVVNTGGAFVYWWGAEDTVSTASCTPDTVDPLLCDNGDDPFVLGGALLRKAYVQKDLLNDWQADTVHAASMVVVDSIDWGDNLESVPWYINSRVRVETVLFDVVTAPLLGYRMLHTFGLGADEQWGLSVLPDGTPEALDNYLPTIYSNCARLTIQRLLVNRDDPLLANLTWDDAAGEWTGVDPTTGDPLVNRALFNDAVYTVQDGPGYYNAEINVKGKVIYGYTWGVRKLNDGAGDYRLTFSLDGTNCPQTLNTDFEDGVTFIMQPEEESEEVVVAAEPAGEGGISYLDAANNLTYIDIHIYTKKGGTTPRGGGGGGGGGGGSSGGGGGGTGGGGSGGSGGSGNGSHR